MPQAVATYWQWYGHCIGEGYCQEAKGVQVSEGVAGFVTLKRACAEVSNSVIKSRTRVKSR